MQSHHSALTKPNEVLFGENTARMLLMSKLALRLASLLLNFSSFDFFLDTLFSGFKPLGLNELRIPNLLVFFLLDFHNSELFFHEHLHLCLLKCSQAENVQHWFDFCVEVKDENSFGITDLSSFTVILMWHLWLEQGDGWSVQVKFSCHFFLRHWRLVRDVLGVWVCLDFEMSAARDGLG